MASATQLTINIIANATQTTNAIRNVNSQVQNMANNINRSTTSASNGISHMGDSFMRTALKTAAVVVGVETIGAAIGRVTNAGIEFIKTIDDSRAAFKVMAGGSQDEADKLLNKVVNLARTSPLSTSEVVKGAQTLMGFGVAIEDVESKLTTLGNIARGNDDRFSRLVLAFGQVTAAGRLMGQETLQFINAGFNPLAEIAEVLAKKLGGVASDYMPKLKKSMENGEISVQTVANAMKLATSEGGKFNGMMEEMSKTFSGQMNIFKDNAVILIGGAFKPITDYLTSTFLPTMSAVMEMIILTLRPFGIKVESIAEAQARMSQESEEAAKKTKKLGKETEKADKAFQSNLQSFDQLHVLQKEISKDAKKGGLKDLEKITQEAADKVAKSKMVEKIDAIKKSIQSFFDDIKTNPTVIAYLGYLSAEFDILKTIVEQATPVLIYFYDNFLVPLAKWTGGIIIDWLKGMTKNLKELGNYLKEHKTIVEIATITLASLGAAFVIVSGATWVWGKAVAMATILVDGAKIAIAFLGTTIGIVTLTIAAALLAIGLMIYYWEDVRDVVAQVSGGFVTIGGDIKKYVTDAALGAAAAIAYLIYGMEKIGNKTMFDPVAADKESLKQRDTVLGYLSDLKAANDAIDTGAVGMAAYNQVKSIKSWQERQAEIASLSAPKTIPLTPFEQWKSGTMTPSGASSLIAPTTATTQSSSPELVDALAQALNTLKTAEGGKGKEAIFNMDGKEIARALLPYIEDEAKRQGLKVISN